MKRSPEISVIIPCYQNEKTVLDTLESINNQVFRDFECLFILDGCTDGTREKIETRIEKLCPNTLSRDRYRVIDLGKNYGTGFARGKGADLANGKYIFFLDADDLIPEFCLERLYNIAEHHNVDLVVGESEIFIGENENLDLKLQKNLKQLLFTRFYDRPCSLGELAEIPTLLLEAVMSCTLTGKLFRRSVWQEFRCNPPVGLTMSDDLIAMKKFLFASKATYLTPMIIMYYRKGHSSLTQTRTLRAYDSLEATKLMYKELFPSFVKLGLANEFDNFARINIVRHAAFYLPIREIVRFYGRIPAVSQIVLATKKTSQSLENWSIFNRFGFFHFIFLIFKELFYRILARNSKLSSSFRLVLRLRSAPKRLLSKIYWVLMRIGSKAKRRYLKNRVQER